MSELSIAESIRQDYEDEIERLKERIEDLNIINEEHQILNGMIRKELQEKENIIKEAREYILTHKLYCFKYDEEELFEITTDKKAKDELLEILDKVGSDKE